MVLGMIIVDWTLKLGIAGLRRAQSKFGELCVDSLSSRLACMLSEGPLHPEPIYDIKQEKYVC